MALSKISQRSPFDEYDVGDILTLNILPKRVSASQELRVRVRQLQLPRTLYTADRPLLPFPETPGRPTAAQEAMAALSGERPQMAIGPGLPFAGQAPAQPTPLCTDPAPNIFVQAQAEEWRQAAAEQRQQVASDIYVWPNTL